MDTSGMQRYQSRRIVHAGEITHIVLLAGGKAFQLANDDGHEIVMSYEELGNRPIPGVGWYLIAYQDGYISFCPPESFEAGYVRVDG